MIQTDLLELTMEGCIEAALEAADARNSDFAALVGCQARPDQDGVAGFRRQCDQFGELADRLRQWQLRLADGVQGLDRSDKQILLADLRLVLIGVRIAAFDVGLYGRGAQMTDTEIADELGKYARLDSQLRQSVIPQLKIDLGVTDTQVL